MFKKLFSIVPAICLIALTGCEDANHSSKDNEFTYSGEATVGSISQPITGMKGDVAQIDDRGGNYIIVITDGTHLQKLKTDHTGFNDIPLSDYTIIKPGDQLQFAYQNDEVIYGSYPPLIRPSTIRIMK